MRRSLTIITVALLVVGSTANAFAANKEIKVPYCSAVYGRCVTMMAVAKCDAAMKKTLQNPAPGSNPLIFLFGGKSGFFCANVG